jgi:hypothetical protein
MDFRWVAGITLWTMLSGPVFVGVQQFVGRAPAAKVTVSTPASGKLVKAPAQFAIPQR